MDAPSLSPHCPLCAAAYRQTKNGKTISGSQQYKCHACQKSYNPNPKKQGYPKEIRQQALKMYVDGVSFRRIARFLEVNPQTVVNWVNAGYPL